MQIVTDAAINPDGDLHVDGDIDLSGHRYASLNPRTRKTLAYGSGEPGALVIRAPGNLEVFGSINDGFDGSRPRARPPRPTTRAGSCRAAGCPSAATS